MSVDGQRAGIDAQQRCGRRELCLLDQVDGVARSRQGAASRQAQQGGAGGQECRIERQCLLRRERRAVREAQERAGAAALQRLIGTDRDGAERGDERVGVERRVDTGDPEELREGGGPDRMCPAGQRDEVLSRIVGDDGATRVEIVSNR